MDYYIVYTVTEKIPKINLNEKQQAEMPRKNFFWCSSLNFVFSSLPDVSQQDAAQLVGIDCLFTGEFDTVLVESADEPKVIDAAAGIILPPKHLTELDRLAVTVQEIERSCSAIPKGSYKYTPLHQITTNEAFKGLSKDEAFSADGWQHLRDIQNPEKKDMI